MDAMHFLFYLFMGIACQFVSPLPMTGTMLVSAGWHEYRNDLHSAGEMAKETRTALAGAAIGKALQCE